MPYLPIAALIISNLVPVFGVLYDHWNASPIILLYFLETVVIGFFTFLKIIFAKQKSGKLVFLGKEQKNPGPLIKLFILLFFATHFSMFLLSVGMWFLTLFVKNYQLTFTFLLSVAGLIFSHGVSFLVNYIGKKEYEEVYPILLSFTPYPRVILMLVTVITTGLLVRLTGQNVIALIVLIVLKTAVDLASQTYEDKGNNIWVMKPWATKFTSPAAAWVERLAEQAYNTSVATGEFEKIAKDLDPEYVAYIKNYWATPRKERKNLAPPPGIASGENPCKIPDGKEVKVYTE